MAVDAPVGNWLLMGFIPSRLPFFSLPSVFFFSAAAWRRQFKASTRHSALNHWIGRKFFFSLHASFLFSTLSDIRFALDVLHSPKELCEIASYWQCAGLVEVFREPQHNFVLA